MASTNLPDSSSRRRLLVVCLCIVVLGFGVVIYNLFGIQITKGDFYQQRAISQQLRTTPITANRGTIYDRNGIVLATSVEATTIYANPVEVSNAVQEAQALADVLGGEADEYQDLLSTPSTTFVYIKRQADVEAAEKVKELKLDGIYFIADMRREYPHGSVGGQVVGRACVLAEGDALARKDITYLAPLPVFNGDGTVKE